MVIWSRWQRAGSGYDETEVQVYLGGSVQHSDNQFGVKDMMSVMCVYDITGVCQ